jgi:hypothetical protein
MSHKEEFSKKIQSLLNEYGYSGFGMQLLPTQNAEWPGSADIPPESNAEPEVEVPPSTNQVTVTSGETTPIDEPRQDLAMQNSGKVLDPESMTEISSLLITIGFILSNSGNVPDKFDTPAVLEFLQKNFSKKIDVQQTQPSDSQPSSCSAYMEQRKLLESKFKNEK